MHGFPGSGHPPMCCFLLRSRRRRVYHDRMLELEQLSAVDEGGGVGSDAVVRATPRHEVQLAILAWVADLQECLSSLAAASGGSGRFEKLRHGYQMRPLSRWIVRPGPVPALSERSLSCPSRRRWDAAAGRATAPSRLAA